MLCSLAMTQGILKFPSFLSAGLPAGLRAGLVRGCFLRVLAWGAAKFKGQRKSRIPSINLEFPKSCVIPRSGRGMTSQNRDPPVKLGDDIVGNSRIPSANLEFPTYFKLKFSLNVTFRYTGK